MKNKHNTTIKAEDNNKDLDNLERVSKEFPAQIEKANFEYKRKWADKTYYKIMEPVDKLNQKSLNTNTNPVLGFGCFFGSLAICLPCLTVAKIAKPIAFFAGSVKEKIKERKINKKIHPSIGEQIKFKR